MAGQNRFCRDCCCPRLTALISIPVRAAVGTIAGRFAGDVGGFYTDSEGNLQQIIVSNPSDTGWTFSEAIRNSLFSSEFIGGAVSLGASILSEELDINPLLTNLGFRAISGGLEGLTDFDGDGNAGERFVFGITGVLKDSLVNVVTLGGPNISNTQRAFYVSNLISFQAQRGDLDIFDLFELHANQILGRDTTESILQTGQNIGDYFKAKRAANDFVVKTDENGNIVHEYAAGANKFVLNEDETVLLKRQFGNNFESGEFTYDQATQKWVLKNGAAVYQTSQGTIEYTIRNGQVSEVNVTNNSGEIVTVFGNEAFPLDITSRSGGEFVVNTGIVANSKGETVIYKDGFSLAPAKNHFISYTDPAIGGPVGGTIGYLQAYSPDGVSVGHALYADDFSSYQLREGNTEVAQVLLGATLDNMVAPEPLEAGEQSVWQIINDFQLDTAAQLDAAADKIFDYVRPALDGLEMLMPQMNADAIDFVTRTVAHGLIDTIRFSTDFNAIKTETGELVENWETLTNDERLVRALSIGGKSLNEIFRGIDLVGFGSIFVAGVRGVGRTATIEALLSSSGIKKLAGETLEQAVKRLLKSTHPDDIAELGKMFNNPALRAEFLKVTKSIDDVAEAFKRGYLSADEAVTANIIRSGHQVNADFLARNPGGEIPWDPFEDVIEKGVRSSFNVIDGDPLVRVFVPTTENASGVGRWIVRKSQIAGKSPAEIKQILALPAEPSHVTDVVFKSTDTVFIRDGIAGINEYGIGGAKQFEIIHQVDEDWFVNKRLLEEL